MSQVWIRYYKKKIQVSVMAVLFWYFEVGGVDIKTKRQKFTFFQNHNQILRAYKT